MNECANPMQDVMQSLRNIIVQAVEKAIDNGELTRKPIPDFTIEIPADTKNGDFACNIAMASAKTYHQSPRAIATAISDCLDLTTSAFTHCEIAGPGFMNFFLHPSWFDKVVEKVLQEKQNYGKSDEGKHQKVMVEFVSANPTGPMHIGNARGGAMGNCLASILETVGYDVTREFYVNDAGNQIEKFAVSLEVRYLQLFYGEEKILLPEDAYQGADITAHARNFAEIYHDKYLHTSSEERKKALVDYALPLNIQKLQSDLGKYRIVYDEWFFESKLHQDNTIAKIVDILKGKGLTYEKDGALWYKATAFGCEKDDVLVRANGIPTYFAADIAYHYNKFAVRGFDRVINIWGADHHGHVQRLKGAMDAIGLDGDKLDIVLMQMVRLVRNGAPVKVSKRTGKSITLSDLLDEIPVDAACFFFNMREANTHLDFDLDLAVAESSDNPVYYVQYAHARICSILKKLQEDGFEPTCEVNGELLVSSEERELIRLLAGFPNELLQAAHDYDPARITRCLLDVASLFHKFYNAHRVKGNDHALTQNRLNLCLAVKVILQNGLHILKITTPETM